MLPRYVCFPLSYIGPYHWMTIWIPLTIDMSFVSKDMTLVVNNASCDNIFSFIYMTLMITLCGLHVPTAREYC
ncbi:hypothetical protein EV426DRAFT_614486 [Tirmania nivea]|nr:hypothetical protein EV426DRAFT_614486 [Tirmania nivea]